MLVGALALSACAGRLEPAATAQLAPGAGKAALAIIEGVTVMARTNAWRGFPSDLDRQMTPILITIRNDRAAPVGVKLGEILLVASSGRRFAALPPPAIEGAMFEPVSALPSTVGGPYGAGGLDGGASDPAYATVRLPTRDMLALALPDAPVRPGQLMQGFVYFERVAPKGTSVDLVLPLVEVGSDHPLGEARIPFVFQ